VTFCGQVVIPIVINDEPNFLVLHVILQTCISQGMYGENFFTYTTKTPVPLLSAATVKPVVSEQRFFIQ
jgi:hypothetical protein